MPKPRRRVPQEVLDACELAEPWRAGQTFPKQPGGQSVEVLGMGLAATDYPQRVKTLVSLACHLGATAVGACNTHLAALSRLWPDFKGDLGYFDFLLPAGMPLFWGIRKKGAELD